MLKNLNSVKNNLLKNHINKHFLQFLKSIQCNYVFYYLLSKLIIKKFDILKNSKTLIY